MNSLGLEADADNARANAEFRAVLQHGGADAFFVIECAGGGVHVLEINKRLANFQHAVIARNFGIVQGNVLALPPQNDAGLG